jgi:hypothetical protein
VFTRFAAQENSAFLNAAFSGANDDGAFTRCAWRAWHRSTGGTQRRDFQGFWDDLAVA